MLEQELAGILLAKMSDVLDYDRSQCTDAADVIVASGDIYYQFIANDIIDMDHFTDKNAGKAEQSVASAFSDYKQQVLDQLKSTMEDANAAFYTDLPREQQAYLSYIVNDILTQNGVLDQNAIDTSDATYKNWKEDEQINVYTYLNYAISQNWIDTSELQKYVDNAAAYSDASEIYKAIINYVQDRLASDKTFDKLIYRYMIKAGTVSGQEIAMILYEQGVLEYDSSQYEALASGSVSAYDFIRGKLQTPGYYSRATRSGTMYRIYGCNRPG